MKLCGSCGIEKNIEGFYRDRCNKDGRAHSCKVCVSEQHKKKRREHPDEVRKYESNWRKNRDPQKAKDVYRRYVQNHPGLYHRKTLKQYGLSIEEYNMMYTSQGGLCAICGKPEDKMNRYKNVVQRLAVDHNHLTGKIRGLLCHGCNLAIGYLNDNPAYAFKLGDYLLKFND